MKQMKEKLSQILDSALGQIEASKELDKLNEIRVSFLGKKGELTSVLKSMKEVAPEDRPKVGQMVNEARQKIEPSKYNYLGRSGKNLYRYGI